MSAEANTTKTDDVERTAPLGIALRFAGHAFCQFRGTDDAPLVIAAGDDLEIVRRFELKGNHRAFAMDDAGPADDPATDRSGGEVVDRDVSSNGVFSLFQGRECGFKSGVFQEPDERGGGLNGRAVLSEPDRMRFFDRHLPFAGGSDPWGRFHRQFLQAGGRWIGIDGNRPMAYVPSATIFRPILNRRRVPSMVFRNLLMLSLAGAAGTLARYGASELVAHLAGRKFAWSTLAVNLIGSFLFGLVWALVTRRQMLSPQAGLIILTGFMGAFTTFSTFAFESSEFLLNGKWSLAIANLAAQNGLGMLAVIAGAALARVV